MLSVMAAMTVPLGMGIVLQAAGLVLFINGLLILYNLYYAYLEYMLYGGADNMADFKHYLEVSYMHSATQYCYAQILYCIEIAFGTGVVGNQNAGGDDPDDNGETSEGTASGISEGTTGGKPEVCRDQ